MLDDRFASVLAAKDATDFRTDVLRFAKWLGFDWVGAFVAVDKSAGEADFYAVDNAPAAYLEAYESPVNRRRDPVMQHCRHRGTPIAWDQSTYLRSGSGEKWEEQAAFGFRVGLGVALHLPGGLHFMVGVSRDQPLPVEPAEKCRLVADLCLYAAFAQEPAMELLRPSGGQSCGATPPLSMRELEVLRWTADGKTAWEVGRILGISEQTATRHAYRAAQKLGCVSKMQAVAKALRLGLVR